MGVATCRDRIPAARAEDKLRIHRAEEPAAAESDGLPADGDLAPTWMQTDKGTVYLIGFL